MRNDEDATRIIYKGALFHIGQFRRGPKHPNFGGPHWSGGTLMVFPRTSVTITHAGQEPVIANPNTVMFYNDQQVYSRGPLSEVGDMCEWFGMDALLVADAIRPFHAHVDDHLCQPFQFSHGPSDAVSYLMQRLVVDHILKQPQIDTLFIEETILYVLKRVILNSYSQHGRMPHPSNIAREQEIVEASQRVLATYAKQNLSLKQLALHLNYSAFHLCRLFRKHTGQSIHQYFQQLRLRTALEYAMDSSTDLTSLALKLGFSSHSHFTAVFRKTFGIAPSTLRKISGQQLRELRSKILIV